MKTIIFANQKGGVGKTTTALAVASELSKKHRVLAIDGDPQANFTLVSCGGTPDRTLEDIFMKRDTVASARRRASIAPFDCIAGSLNLADADRRFTDAFDYLILKKALKEVAGEYDFCIIDSPPALGILSVNYLTASDYIVVPLNTSAFSIQGLSHLAKIIDDVRENANPGIKYAGILLTRVVKRAKVADLSKDVLESVTKELGTKVFATSIRQSVIVENSHIEKENIMAYATKARSGIAEDYAEFTRELVREVE